MENLTRKREEALRARNKILMHIITYVVIMSFLCVLNYMTTPNHWWVIWPALGWGLGLILNIVEYLLFTRNYHYER